MIYKVRNLEPGSTSEQQTLSQDALWKVKMKVLEEVKKLLPPECWSVVIDLKVEIAVENKPSTWTIQVEVPTEPAKQEEPHRVMEHITLTAKKLEVGQAPEETK